MGESRGCWLKLRKIPTFQRQVEKEEAAKEGKNKIGETSEELQKPRKVGEWLCGAVLAAQKFSGVRTKVAVGFSNGEEICDLEERRVVQAKASFWRVE